MANQKKKIKHKLKLFGLLNHVDFYIAKCCVEDLWDKSPDFFHKPVIKPMMEMEWKIFIEKTIKEQKGDMWGFVENSVVFDRKNLVGGPKKLLEWAEKEDNYENFRPMYLYENFAQKGFQDYIKKSKHTFLFMDFNKEEEILGRIIIELFDDLVPKTCMNFKILCTGELSNEESEVKLHYLHSTIHRVVPQGWIQGGDIKSMKGNDGISIYGDEFEDENYIVKHDKRGIVGMANHGPHTNSSQFYITLSPAPWLDNKFVAFGQVVEGNNTLSMIESIETGNERPLKEVSISNLGVCPIIFGEGERESPPPKPPSVYLNVLNKVKAQLKVKLNKNYFKNIKITLNKCWLID